MSKNQAMEWCDKHYAAAITGLSIFTLREWRLNGKLREGIHWVRLGNRCVRYNSHMLRDFMVTQSEPKIH